MSRNKDGVRMGYTERVTAQKTAAEPFSGVVVRREPLTSDRGLGSRSLVLEENSKVDRGTVLIHRSNVMLGGGEGAIPKPKERSFHHGTQCAHHILSMCLHQRVSVYLSATAALLNSSLNSRDGKPEKHIFLADLS